MCLTIWQGGLPAPARPQGALVPWPHASARLPPQLCRQRLHDRASTPPAYAACRCVPQHPSRGTLQHGMSLQLLQCQVRNRGQQLQRVGSSPLKVAVEGQVVLSPGPPNAQSLSAVHGTLCAKLNQSTDKDVPYLLHTGSAVHSQVQSKGKARTTAVLCFGMMAPLRNADKAK